MARTIEVKYLARVEGEGSLVIRFNGKEPTSAELRIFEPPRFFEGLLRGRAASEAPDITARICGICPVAYQMSACRAVEAALGVSVQGSLARLRRLLYCGEWIESHALHVFLLHLPDFLGFPDALALAKRHPEWVRSGLAVKKAGNAIVAQLGGREVHPINVKVGGFFRAPSRAELSGLVPELERARDAMLEALAFLARLEFPTFERPYEFVSLREEREYPMMEGRLVSSEGLDIAIEEYDQHFVEQQVPHSTALHSSRRGGGAYFCGPLARFNLNADRLRPLAAEAAERIGLRAPCRNPYRSLLVRGVELIQAIDDALAIIAEYDPPPAPALELTSHAGVGHGCTEAPRGLLYHRYAVDERGAILDARIVPPTSQNQATIERDLLELGRTLAELPHAEATLRAEQAVRNYDPCISCSTHFLSLRFEQEAP
jgi:coenzyme F420-reducing hydrogenase alpha subunit